MRINTNVGSLNAWRNLTATDGNLSKNLERLSSGFRINRAGDDVAGLAISENMRAQVKGLNQAIKNAQDGISLLQTAEGSLNEVHSMLHRMRELSVQSANGTLQPEDRKQIQTEMDNLTKEVTRITNATQFNSMDLIDGSLTKDGVRDVSLQIGPNSGQTVEFEIGAMDSKSLGISRNMTTAKVFHTNGVDTSAPADGTDDVFMAQDGGNFTKSVDEVGATGAGLAEGEYFVKWDNNNKTVQLFSDASMTPDKAIGTAVRIFNEAGDALKADTVTIGDANTAETITLNLESFTTISGLGQDAIDRLQVGSRVAAVTDDADTDAHEIVSTTGTSGGTGITDVGWGMKTDDYTLKVVDIDTTTKGIVLQNSAGENIGVAKSLADIDAEMAASGTVTLGDQATGRTLSFKANGLVAAYGGGTGTLAVGDTDVISVVNNNQAAEGAKFDGHVKYANAQVSAGLNVSSVDGAKAAIGKIDEAIGKVSYQRSQLGAITNRLEHTISNLQVVAENLTASESRIRDVDMALEMTQFTKQQILMQSGTAMLAQANQKNQAVLSLLR